MFKVYITITITASFLPEREVDALALVVPTTAYHADVPIVIGTTVVREYNDMFNNESDVPPEWKVAFVSLQIGFVGSD